MGKCLATRRALLASALLMLGLFNGGCTIKTALVEPTVPEIVNDGLKTATTEENQERIKLLLKLPEVDQASQALARALVAGALDELTGAERRDDLDRLTSDFVLATSEAFAQGTEQHLGPALMRQTSNVLRANLEVLLADGVRHDSAAYVTAVTHAFGSTLNTSLAQGIQNDTGPALTRVLHEQVTPEVARGLDSELRPVLGRISRDAAREAGLGFGDALAGGLGEAVDARFFKRVDAWFAQGQGFAEQALSQLRIALVVLALLLIAVGIALFRMYRALQKRTRALELVTHAVKDFTQKAGDRGVVELVELRGKQGPGRSALNEFLIHRPELKA